MSTRRYSALDLSRIPAIGLRVENLASDPAGLAAADAGLVWLNTGTGEIKYWTGTATIILNNVPAAGSITNAQIATAAAIALSKLATDPLARANHTGTQLAATISDFIATRDAQRLDQHAAPTTAVNLNAQRIIGLADPTAATDAATRQYVDNARAGIAGVKDPVRVAATANVVLTGPGATLDGITLAAGDRFLATAQTTGTENGIWLWNGAAVAATRPTDADTTGEILDGTVVAVADGTKAGTQYIQAAAPSGAPGAWTQVWTQFSTGGTTYTAGTGLTLTGSQFSLTNPVTVALGGTGAATAAAARTNLGITGGQKYAATLGAFTVGTGVAVTHGLGTTDVVVMVRDATSGAMVEIDITVTDANTVTLTSAVAIAANTLRAVVLG